MAPIRSPGFTMIELLIGVVVVAILAAIAIPSYSAYVIRGQRAAAKAALEQAAQFLERNYTTSGCYNFATVAECAAGAGKQITPPVTSSPDTGQETYAIAAAFTPPANSNFNAGQYFLLSAAPCGTSATACTPSNPSFKDATCGALTLDNTGTKGIDASGTGTGTPPDTTSATAASCWQR